MLQKKLKKHFLEVVLTTSEGKTYTAGEILKKAELIERSLSCIGVSTTDTIGIYVTNEMYGIAAIIACLSYETNFVILDTSDNIEDTKVKTVLTKLSYGVIIAEEVIDETLLTLHPGTFKIISKGWNYNALDEDTKDYMSKIFEVVSSIGTGKDSLINKDDISLAEAYLHPNFEHVTGTFFHQGISKGLYTASRIKHSAIYQGIKDSYEELSNNIENTLLTVEPFNSLYDILNGIIAPILHGKHVTIGKGNNIADLFNSFKEIEVKTLYINTQKLEILLKTLEQESTPFCKLLCHSFIMRRLFKKHISKHIKTIITHGKITKRKLLNSIKKKYTVLYVMSEVSSYIASGTWTRLPKHLWLTPRQNVSIDTTGDVSDFGELNVTSTDLFHSYLENNNKWKYFDITVQQTSPKDENNKFRTEDVGLVRNNKVLIKNKTKNIFVNEKGLVIETGKILSIAKRFKIVNEATIAIHNKRLILIIELDFEYIEFNSSFNNIETLKKELSKIKKVVNKSVKPFSKIQEVTALANSSGLPRKNFKIVSYHF